MHDEICPEIINAKWGIEYSLAKQEPQKLESAIEFLDRLYIIVKTFLKREKWKFDFETGLIQNLMIVIERYKARGAFKFSPHVDIPPEEGSQEIEKELAIITNVLLDNIEKHAEAEEVILSIVRENGSVRMIISDDGKGFDPDNIPEKPNSDNSGIGLKNVKYRVEKLGGTIDIQSNQGEGTKIEIIIPLHKIK